VCSVREISSVRERWRALSDRFITHMLAKNGRLEEDLIDQLFNASEKRLARTLLLLARYGKLSGPRRVLPRIPQEVLAQMVGTTRSRVNFFMNKFRRPGRSKGATGPRGSRGEAARTPRRASRSRE
jgi:CRP-like cAMP-binding protein